MVHSRHLSSAHIYVYSIAYNMDPDLILVSYGSFKTFVVCSHICLFNCIQYGPRSHTGELGIHSRHLSSAHIYVYSIANNMDPDLILVSYGFYLTLFSSLLNYFPVFRKYPLQEIICHIFKKMLKI